MKTRCFGDKPGQQLYADYHDYEWGLPLHDDQKLFELLVLEGAQAGLSWETVLKKRAAYRKVFHQFVPEKVALMSDAELESLVANPEIIRHRLKIFSARKNANVFLEIQQVHGSFDDYLWGFVNFEPIKNHWQTVAEVPVTTVISDALSKDLKIKGMSFVGSTIMYAYMQAVGMVNDHLTSCWRYNKY
jgi:DNA-3-methyladenine glycosylase I